MKKILLFAAATMLLAISCNKEDEVTGRHNYGNSNKEKAAFYATTENTASPETKVYADEELKVLWNENDCISLFNCVNVNDKYMFDGEDGDNGGSFSFEEEGPDPSVPVDLDHIYAVYPYSTNTEASVDNSEAKIAVDLPAEQTYKEHSFGIGANTMVAVTDNNFLGFKNACGYLKFRFYGDNVKVNSIILEGNNGEKIAGKAYITPSVDSAPVVAMDDAATTSITINCEDLVTLTTSKITDFIVVIPPTTFTKGFKVCVVDNQGRFFEKTSTKSLTISRNKIESMGIIKVTPGFVVFEDTNFKTYCLNNFDKNNDGKISYPEAQEITRIDTYTYNPDITSLKGIEIFKNLSYLRCRGRSLDYKGKLTSLDVSCNTVLDTLICEFNQLTSLDVSKNTALVYLDCHRNELTSLDVSNNKALQDFRCGSNQITSLDVSNNTELVYFGCGENQLKTLNVRNNTMLQRLGCSTNQLTSLDVSSNTALTYLHCEENQLISLDVSNNTLLETLDAWPQAGTLYRLWKKAGQSITYRYAGETIIVPSDYGTEIIEVD